MAISISEKKIELIKWLSALEDSSVIEKLMEFKHNEGASWWDDVSEQEMESIRKGVEEADKGLLSPDSEAKAMYGKWL